MIRFPCPGCGRVFTVRDQDVGRRAKCKTCGNPVVVPLPEELAATNATVGAIESHALASASAPAVEGAPATSSDPVHAAPPSPASSPAPRIPMRLRRLRADAEQMAAAFADFPPIRIVSTRGDPAEVYQIEYAVKSLDRGKKKGTPVPRDRHLVEIQLTSDYPRLSPKCKMLTPIFHPNIDPATICVGDHWTAGERLVDLAVRIGEMLAYQAYNVKSPLDAEAAMWADLHGAELPVDTRSLQPGTA